MKSRIIEIPIVERKMIAEDQIIKIIGDKTLTSWQVGKKSSIRSSSHIRGVLSNMVRLGKLDCVKCPHCDIGRMYRVKK